MASCGQKEVRVVLPKVSAWTQLEFKSGPPIHYSYEGEVPMEVADPAASLLGDAAARVNVTKDLSAKEFGAGASCGVSISLSCNQDAQTIAQAINVAGYWALEYCKQELAKAQTEYDQIKAQREAAKHQMMTGAIPSSQVHPPPFKPGK